MSNFTDTLRAQVAALPEYSISFSQNEQGGETAYIYDSVGRCLVIDSYSYNWASEFSYWSNAHHEASHHDYSI